MLPPAVIGSARRLLADLQFLLLDPGHHLLVLLLADSVLLHLPPHVALLLIQVAQPRIVLPAAGTGRVPQHHRRRAGRQKLGRLLYLEPHQNLFPPVPLAVGVEDQSLQPDDALCSVRQRPEGVGGSIAPSG